MPRSVAHRSIRLVLLAVFALLVTGPPAQAAFPGANGKIAFSSNRNGNYEIYTMNPDRTGLTNITNNDPANDYEPAWSPDGTKIAFGRQVGNYTDIYTMNADGTGQTNITNNDPVNDREPAWSPDGTKIAFQSDRDRDDGNWEIYTMNADGSGVARLTTDVREDWSPSWSPDGSKIAFSSTRDGDLEIYTMSHGGSRVVPLTSNPAQERNPNWSPSGSKIAFSSTRDGTSFIYTMNADGSGVVRLTNSSPPLGDTGGDDLPAWSPDGTKIAFDGDRRSVRPPFNFDLDIYTMNADGTGLGNFSNNPLRDWGADWQPIPLGNRPPDCSSVTAAPASLTPADRTLRLVGLSGATDPDSDTVSLTITGVTQDEALTGAEDQTSPDAFSRQLTTDPDVAGLLDNDPDEVYLRAERRNGGDGRVYRISFAGSDGRGGGCAGTATVSAPRKKNEPVVDSAPPGYDSFGG